MERSITSPIFRASPHNQACSVCPHSPLTRERGPCLTRDVAWTNFKLFAAIVLLYIGCRIAMDIFKRRGSNAQAGEAGGSVRFDQMRITHAKFTMKSVEYTFSGRTYSFSPPGIFFMCFVVRVVGGIYGVGGGAMIAPFFVTLFKMPVYTVAGAALMGTFITSLAGMACYQLLGYIISTPLNVAPDWLLGGLFGVGEFCGMYLGAYFQRYVPVRVIKLILCICLLSVAIKYGVDFFI